MTSPLFRFAKFSPAKASTAVAFAHEKLGPDARAHDLALALFLAERAHVVRWNRPVLGDSWLATAEGPWPESAGPSITAAIGRPSVGASTRDVAFFLSRSDCDALRAAVRDVRRDAKAARATLADLPVRDGRYAHSDFLPADCPDREEMIEQLYEFAPYLIFGPDSLPS